MDTTLAPAHSPAVRDNAAALRGAIRSIAAALLAGAVAGFLVGGVLGRLAMRLLALTSPDIAQGRLTDDAARVGQFTLGGSLTLAIFLTVLGAVAGLVYLLVRRILPASRGLRVAGFALLTGTIAGAGLLHDHPSFDFHILQPTWLAVAMFLAIPAGVGAVAAWLTEVLSARDVPRFTGALPRLWRSAPITILGVTLYWVLVAWGAWGILADVTSMAADSPSTWPFTY